MCTSIRYSYERRGRKKEGRRAGGGRGRRGNTTGRARGGREKGWRRDGAGSGGRGKMHMPNRARRGARHNRRHSSAPVVISDTNVLYSTTGTNNRCTITATATNVFATKSTWIFYRCIASANRIKISSIVSRDFAAARSAGPGVYSGAGTRVVITRGDANPLFPRRLRFLPAAASVFTGR